MNTLRTQAPTSVREAVRSDLAQLQREAMLMVLLGLAGAAMLLISIAEASDTIQPVFSISIFLMLLSLLGWLLSARSYLLASWVVVAGISIAVLVLVTSARLSVALPLFALPVGLAALLINAQAGVVLSAAISVFVLASPAVVLPADAAARMIALLQTLGTLGLVVLIERPLLKATEWSWASYAHSLESLNRARDYQVELKQALSDLAAANSQLARLNDFAQMMRKAAEEARQSKEQFVANVSHELRTPLNMVIGFAELVTSSPDSYGARIPPRLIADMNIILRNSRHLSALIDDVLDLSQLEAGRMALIREDTDLREVAESALTAVRQLFASKGLYLESDLEDLPRVWCDKTRIREVMLNLLSNAARFTEQGGVRISVRRDGNDVILSVADTGPGIHPKDMDRLFQPFEQLDGSIRRHHGGTGLGLSISKGFVELHGGKMWIESEPGQGTTVWFRLPIDAPEPLQGGAAQWLRPEWEFRQHTKSQLVSSPVVRPRVVIVERGRTLHRLFSRYQSDAELVCVTSLDQALTDLAHTPARLLLINGSTVSEVLNRLTRRGILPTGIPTIVCAVPELPETTQALGATDYLVKPVSQEALLTAFERLQLRGKRVLVVDDEPEAQLLFRRMLLATEQGFRIMTAENGVEALSIMRRRKPNVVLLDLVMPDMDGFRVLTECQNDPALKDIPIILISAKDPDSHPISTSSLAVTLANGLSAQQLLASIEALQAILLPEHPEPRENHSD